MMLTEYIFWTAGLLFAVASVLALIKIITGPTILDRIVASDKLVTTLMLAVGAEMVYNRHTNTIVLMIALAATSFLGTVMVARHVRRRENEQITANGKRVSE